MKVLSHRGYWKANTEKNTPVAFERSFRLGFGTETDLRDAGGRLVISHDVPVGEVQTASEFFAMHRQLGPDLPLALNIKADGLHALLREALDHAAVSDYFVFDMAVPDSLAYLQQGFSVFTRHSEIETDLPGYDRATGVWVDCFYSEWVTEQTIHGHLKAGKRVCLVSPELHRRPPDAFWNALRAMPVSADEHVMLCTDRPEEARAFFV